MKKAVLIGLVVLGLSDAAHAADLYTAPIWGGGANGFVNCKIANVSSAARDIQVTGIDASGNILSDSGIFTLAAGQSVSALGGAGVVGNVRCHFHVQGGKATVRALAAYNTSTAPFSGNDVFAVPAN